MPALTPTGQHVIHRLQKRAQFQAVLSGNRAALTAHFAMHCCAVGVSGCPKEDLIFPVSGVWLGAMVPKRWAKRAVTRNMIKRQIYQAGRDFGPCFQPQAYLIRLRKGFDRKDFVSASSAALKAAVRTEVHALLREVLGPRAAAIGDGTP